MDLQRLTRQPVELTPPAGHSATGRFERRAALLMKDAPLKRSLSVLLPVHNAQATLERHVAGLLEVLPDLTTDFGLLIVDDGSTDATPEVASELAARYPQVRAIRHSFRLGITRAIQTGARHATGDVVITHDGQPGMRSIDVLRLWRDRDRSASPASDLSTAHSGGKWFSRLLPWRNGEESPGRQSSFLLLASGARVDAGAPSQGTPRSVGAAAPSARVRRPNFLGQLKDLALGE